MPKKDLEAIAATAALPYDKVRFIVRLAERRLGVNFARGNRISR